MATETSIAAILDPYNAFGSTRNVSFNTSKTDLWKTSPARCHVNWVVLDSRWEGEFCRVAEKHPRVRSYVKNHSLNFEVPYRCRTENRMYRPDFIVRVDDGHGDEDLLNLMSRSRATAARTPRTSATPSRRSGYLASIALADTGGGRSRSLHLSMPSRKSSRSASSRSSTR
jgi:hypothetical protein